MEWIKEKVKIFSKRYKRIVIAPMGKWGELCRDILENEIGFSDVICIDNFKYDNQNIFPMEREANWYKNALYLVTAEREEICREIVMQLKKHVKPSQIARLFSGDGLCDIYGRIHLDFLFVGFQKCGTSSLQEVLVKNPAVFLPKNKETFFVSQIYSPIAHKNFRKLYAASTGNKAVGGIEPTYTKFADIIYDYFGPDLKILMCVRNPREAAYSLFKMHMRDSHKNTLYYMKKYGRISPEVFDEWVDKEDDKEVFRYMDCVHEYLKFYKKENIKVIVFEELVNDTERAMNELQEFIGLDENSRIKYDQMPVVNTGTTVPKDLASVYINEQVFWLVCAQTDIDLQTQINNLRGKISEITNIEYNEEMLEETAQKLNLYYKDSIRELEIFMNKSLKGIWY